MAITVTSVSPKNLPEDGGVTVRIVGTNLNTVTSVTFDGVDVGALVKTPTSIDFPAPPLVVGSRSYNVVVNSPTNNVTNTAAYKVLANGKSPRTTKWAYGWHSGRVDTTAVGVTKSQGEQQRDLMEIKYSDGTDVPAPLGANAPEYPDLDDVAIL